GDPTAQKYVHRIALMLLHAEGDLAPRIKCPDPPILGLAPRAGDTRFLATNEAGLIETIEDEAAFSAADDAIEQLVAVQAIDFDPNAGKADLAAMDEQRQRIGLLPLRRRGLGTTVQDPLRDARPRDRLVTVRDLLLEPLAQGRVGDQALDRARAGRQVVD